MKSVGSMAGRACRVLLGTAVREMELFGPGLGVGKRRGANERWDDTRG